MDTRAPLGVLFENGGGESSVADKVGSHGQFFAGPKKAPPSVFIGGWPQEQAFAGPAPGPFGKQPCRQDSGRIADQAISRAKELREIGEDVVGNGSARPVDNEQARLVPLRRRRLGDQFRRQRIVKKFGGKRWRHEKGDSRQRIEA